MRTVTSTLAVGLLATALAGCASSTTPQSTAAAGDPSSARAATSASASASAASTPDTSSQPPAPSSSTAHPTPATKPSPTSAAHHSSSSPSKPKSSSGSTATPGSVPTSFGYNPAADSKAQIDAARAAAKADGREVLLDFGASWCGNCVAMDEAFHTAGVQSVLASSYHLVQIDVDASGNMGLLSQYAPSNSGSYGLPVLLIISPSGATRVDTDKSGNPGFDTSSFLAFLKKWAA
jgi:thiol-disulfide isomerase/thioredoxin